MLTIQQMLWLDLGLLATLLVCTVLLVRQALKQGRAKKALENSIASAQAPIAATPHVASRSVPHVASAGMSHEDMAAVFAPAHAVPTTRRPLWADTLPIIEADPWIDESPAPAEPVGQETLLFSLEPPVAETVTGEIIAEEVATPELPREQVGILFLDDDQDVSSLRLAEVRELSPRAKAEAPQEQESVATVEFIDGIYADPIDGIPFTAGEEIVPCACGTAYRMDTAQWLREEADGSCVQCHKPLTAESIVFTEEAPAARLSQTA
jgi:hypothetical protein